jgi:hypothetical protein
MARLFDFMKYDKDAPGAEVDDQTARELRRLANLFLLSATTMIILLIGLFARTLDVTFISSAGYAVIGLFFLLGWAATAVYGVYVTFTARRWGWFALCVIPVTCVPAAVAYAWIRRQEIERAVLGADPSPATRQRRGGKKRR